MSQNLPRRLRIVRVREQSRDIRSFDLMPDDAAEMHGVTFIPGQVAVLRVGEEIVRAVPIDMLLNARQRLFRYFRSRVERRLERTEP